MINSWEKSYKTVLTYFFLTTSFLTASLLVADCPKKIPIPVLFSNPVKTSPQISPDGSKIAFLAPVNDMLNIWVSASLKIDNAKPVTTQQNRDIRLYTWAYDNVHLLFLQDDRGNENYHIYKVNTVTQGITDLTPFEGVKADICLYNCHNPSELLITMNKEDRTLFDVYRLNIDTGELVLDTKNPGSVPYWLADRDLCVRAAWSFDSDGKSLLYRESKEEPWQELMRFAWDEQVSAALMGFSSDSNYLYLTDPRDHDTTSFVRFNLATKEKEIIVRDDIYDIAPKDIIFDADNTLCFVGIQKERIVWTGCTDEHERILKALQKIDDGDLFFCNSSHCNNSSGDQQWVIGFNHDNRSVSYYLFNVQTQKATFLFLVRPCLQEYDFASMVPVQFTARDGLTIHGYLTLPTNKLADQPVPLVLFVHGGPWWRDCWGYSRDAQLFANRGYACLQVNFRGSRGYGKTFLNAGNKEWSGKMHDDLVDAVQWAIDKGIADKTKVAIMGGSYGGYAALVGATFTPDLFCCAIDIVGISNLVSFLESIPPYWELVRKEFSLRVGDLATEEEFLKACSPLFKVDAIKIPLLVIQGAHDPRVKQAESDQIVAAMCEKNLPVEYMLVGDEGHGFTGQKNSIVQAYKIDSFLAKYLGI